MIKKNLLKQGSIKKLRYFFLVSLIKLEEKRISLEQIENIYNIHELIQETTTIVIKKPY